LQTRWIGIAAALIAAYGAGLYYEQSFAPAGCCALTWPNADPVQAERILARTDPNGVNAAAQQQAAVAVRAARPGDPTGWLRLAYADWLSHDGRMTDAGMKALATSYLITPYGGPFSPWRVILSLNNWTILPVATRLDVAREIQVVKTAQYFETTKKAAAGVRDPSGRMAAVVLGIAPR
jgi:hypothetical protein